MTNIQERILVIVPFLLSNWNEWSSWKCSVTCGQGIEIRQRFCPEGVVCKPDPNGNVGSIETSLCKLDECPTWSKWGSWIECSVTCGTGTKSRRRMCSERRRCPGRRVDFESCRMPQPCVSKLLIDDNYYDQMTDGDPPKIENVMDILRPRPTTTMLKMSETWSEWSEFGTCSVTCGTGAVKRSRVCKPGQGAGGVCQGESLEYRPCDSGNACPKRASAKLVIRAPPGTLPKPTPELLVKAPEVIQRIRITNIPAPKSEQKPSGPQSTKAHAPGVQHNPPVALESLLSQPMTKLRFLSENASGPKIVTVDGTKISNVRETILTRPLLPPIVSQQTQSSTSRPFPTPSIPTVFQNLRAQNETNGRIVADIKYPEISKDFHIMKSHANSFLNRGRTGFNGNNNPFSASASTESNVFDDKVFSQVQFVNFGRFNPSGSEARKAKSFLFRSKPASASTSPRGSSYVRRSFASPQISFNQRAYSNRRNANNLFG